VGVRCKAAGFLKNKRSLFFTKLLALSKTPTACQITALQI
jgi:hypothetical protein